MRPAYAVLMPPLSVAKCNVFFCIVDNSHIGFALQGDLVAGNVALRLSEDAQCDTSIGSFGFSFRASLGDPETQSAAQTSSTTFEASVSGAVPSSCSGRPPPAATPPPASRPPPAAPVCAGVFDQAGECCFTVLNSAGQCCAGTVNAASECCPASSPADKCGVCGGENSCSLKITLQVCVYCGPDACPLLIHQPDAFNAHSQCLAQGSAC